MQCARDRYPTLCSLAQDPAVNTMQLFMWQPGIGKVAHYTMMLMITWV